MASSMARLLVKPTIISNAIYTPLFTAMRNSSVPPPRKSKKGTIRYRNLISSARDSLASRGFLRSYKPYTPPENVGTSVIEICNRVLGPDYSSKSSFSREEKFHLLNECFKEFNCSIPNSLLHTINTVDDLIKFYETPITTTVPYDDLASREDLPPNLFIQKEYVRFHPDTDTIFKGISAFPESSTIVTGLNAKKKYKGYRAKMPNKYFNDVHYVKTNLFESA